MSLQNKNTALVEAFNAEHDKLRNEWKKNLWELEQKPFPTEAEKRRIEQLSGMLDGVQILIFKTNQALMQKGADVLTAIQSSDETKVIA